MNDSTGCATCPGAPDPATGPTRRQVVTGAGAAVAFGAPTLAGCAGGKGSTSDGADAPGVEFPASDVPVGGGAIKQGWVVTQPTEGTYKAFSSKCTHQGCGVSQIKDGAIICTCHGSEFSVEDGSVLAGPAQDALPEGKAEVSGDTVKAGPA